MTVSYRVLKKNWEVGLGGGYIEALGHCKIKEEEEGEHGGSSQLDQPVQYKWLYYTL